MMIYLFVGIIKGLFVLYFEDWIMWNFGGLFCDGVLVNYVDVDVISG